MTSFTPTRVAAIIPARGGSKGVPGKNVAAVAGVPLIGRAVEAAHAAGIDDVFVSTDDSAIAGAARSSGASVIDRPADLASDTASSEDALLHAIGVMEAAGGLPTAVAFLQATSPFIPAPALRRAVERVVAGEHDVVFSAFETYAFLWGDDAGGVRGVNHDHHYRPRRQDREPHFQETGAFYVMRTAGFLASRFRFFGNVGIEPVPESSAIEIDTPAELAVARALAPLVETHTASLDIDGLVMDFDGVHTDDAVTVDEDGVESVRVSRADGMGIGLLRESGLPLLILSKERNPVVSARARKLGVEVRQGIDAKAQVLRQWCDERGLDPSRVAYVGNDVNDLEAMAIVGWPIAVADARPEVVAAARRVLSRAGGNGALRELADQILAPMDDARPRALVVADSDSYLKWAVARAGELSERYDVEVTVVRNAVTPSGDQRRAAVDGRLPSEPGETGLRALTARLRADPPALLLLACRGPLIEVLLLDELHGRRAATVVAAGIPGIWFPHTRLGLDLRAACDMLVVHSERERRAVEAELPLGRLRAVGMASLVSAQQPAPYGRPRVVFAPQALVPASVTDRERVLDALISYAHAHPDQEVVIKVRGGATEAQTHEETAPFDVLAAGRELPPNLVVGRGPLRDYLGDAVGFVTVSSTAVLEAIAAGVPSLTLVDFGVGPEQINVVFEGSGLMGDLGDLEEGRFRTPHPHWMADNYFQSRSDWVEVAHACAAEPRDDETMPDRLSGPAKLPQRLRRRAVALGAADETWVGRLLAPVRWVRRTSTMAVRGARAHTRS